MSKAFLTISQASEQVGVSRQSVWRKCKAGIIPSSIDKRTGATVIQVVDLIAHYGSLEPNATVAHATKATPNNNTQQRQSNTATVLQQELERLRKELEEKKQEIAELKREVREEKSQWIDEKNWLKQLIDRQSLLLGSTPAPAAPQPSPEAEQPKPAKNNKTKKPKRDKAGRFA